MEKKKRFKRVDNNSWSDVIKIKALNLIQRLNDLYLFGLL